MKPPTRKPLSLKTLSFCNFPGIFFQVADPRLSTNKVLWWNSWGPQILKSKHSWKNRWDWKTIRLPCWGFCLFSGAFAVNSSREYICIFRGFQTPNVRRYVEPKNLRKLFRRLARWWFQKLFIFTPTWGRFQFLTNIFQRGWNHQLANVFPFLKWSIFSRSSRASYLFDPFEVGTHRISELYKDHQRRCGLTLKKHNTGEVAMFFFRVYQKKTASTNSSKNAEAVNADRYMYYMFFAGSGWCLNILTSTNPGLCLFFSNGWYDRSPLVLEGLRSKNHLKTYHFIHFPDGNV